MGTESALLSDWLTLVAESDVKDLERAVAELEHRYQWRPGTVCYVKGMVVLPARQGFQAT